MIRWGVGGCREHHRRQMTQKRRRIKVRTILPRGISPLLVILLHANMVDTVRKKREKLEEILKQRIFFSAIL